MILFANSSVVTICSSSLPISAVLYPWANTVSTAASIALASSGRPNEIRAWTIKKNYSAPNAAGVIHTDFERGFIKAEVIDFDDFIALGGELGAKEKGKLRLEGKDYKVKDGDIIHFKFNVWKVKIIDSYNFKIIIQRLAM